MIFRGAFRAENIIATVFSHGFRAHAPRMGVPMRRFFATFKWETAGPIPLDPKLGKIPKTKAQSIQPTTIAETSAEKEAPGISRNTGEIGGPTGREPTRYGDWERKGRISDF